MPVYSQKSRAALVTAHPLLQILALSVLSDGYDNSVLWGLRDEKTQNELFEKGWSKLRWPDSNHNKKPGDTHVYAIDIVPYPVIWPNKDRRPSSYAKDSARLYQLAGYIRARARDFNIPIRQGADWDGDYEINDQSFDDVAHVELVRSKITKNQELWARDKISGMWRLAL